MNFLTKLRKPEIYFPLILVFIELILLITNYRPGTYLIGWDNVMPEFDLKLNFSRSIFSIWQEYRGLGVMDGLSHAANLMHTVYIWLLSIFLPDSILRYVYTHLTHLAGGVAFFFLLRKLTKNDNASFLGSLFYMLNLGIIQMYFAPLEVFTTHFAALPILALLVTIALEKTNYKNLTLLFLGAFLLSPQGFVPTVFIAFGIMVFFMLLVDLIKNRNFKKIFLVGLIIFCANAFWLVPYTASAVMTGGEIRNSRINQFSSEEIFFRNKSFGDIESVASLKGFMIDAIELNPETFRNTYFMGVWKPLTDSFYYLPLYLVFFLIMGIGIIQAVIKGFKPGGQTEIFAYFLTIIVAFIFLANSTPVAEQINNIIRGSFPLLNEAFRFPFTKFITLFAFCFSVLFTFGLSYLLVRFVRFRKLVIGFTAVIIFTISLPAFQGYFTSPYLRLELPNEYKELFSDMQAKNPDQRVVLFPVQTFWNWQYRSWGHRGSGFSWYAFPQPIMERAFDPWSPYDEQFYNEISYATNTQNSRLFDNVIKKYDVAYILLDQSILNTLSPKEINYDSLKKFLENQKSITREKEYGNLILYKVNENNGWVYELDSDKTRGVYPNYSFEKEDTIYSFADNYVTKSENPSVVNLFPSLFSEKLQENLEFNIANNKDEYTLTPKNLPGSLTDYIVRIPSMFETEFLIPVSVEFNGGQLRLTPLYPKILINGAQVEINEEPIIIIPTIDNPETAEFAETKQKISLNSKNGKAYLINPAVNSIKFQNSAGQSEVVYVDTSALDKKAFYAMLPGGKIESISITVPKIESPTQSINNVIEERKYEIKKKISTLFSNPYSRADAKEGFDYVNLEAVNGQGELAFYLPDLFHEASYILFAETTHNAGLPMRFYVDNDTLRRAEVEAVFSKDIKNSTVVIPKSNNYFRGYGFHFTVKSVGKEFASSSIREIELYPLPAGLIKGMQFVDYPTYEAETIENPKIDTGYNRINTSLYTTKESQKDRYILLSQAYDVGWQAYEVEKLNWLNSRFPFITGNKLDEHVLANNWANAWKTENGGPTVMVFVPSYFQYLGQFITTTAFVILLILYLKHHHLHKHKHQQHHYS